MKRLAAWWRELRQPVVHKMSAFAIIRSNRSNGDYSSLRSPTSKVGKSRYE